MAEKLLTIREVSGILGVSEKEVIDLAEGQALPAYKVGGVYLRFRRDQVEEYKRLHRSQQKRTPVALSDRVADFWYFNDFYILSLLLIAALVYFVVAL